MKGSEILNHYPKLSTHDFGVVRSPGPGLGNLFFPIARALIGQQKHGGVFVHPTMRQIKFGTFLRKERDKRMYGDVIRHRSAGDWRVWVVALSRRKLDEAAYDGIQTGVTVTYSGLRRYFHDLEGHKELIAGWLKERASQTTPEIEPYDIGIHVRLGDFAAASTSSSGSSVRQPIDWYLAALGKAKSVLGTPSPRVVLFTDGDVENIRQMLGPDEIIPDPSLNALGAIINLSKARMIITSRSTFSMWAAYLGSTYAIWDKNFDLAQFFPVRDDLDLQL